MSDARAEYPHETNSKGAFVRQQSRFRQWVKADNSAEFVAQPGRYHLYVSLACPWAHRTVIVRKLKKLEDVISLSVVDPIRDERGWAFRDVPGAEIDPINGFEFLAEAYLKSDPHFQGRVTVPTLWDKQRECVVNNESSEILRMLNREFNEWGDPSIDLYPISLQGEIDAVNLLVYEKINNGVYRTGFATTQTAYQEGVEELFAALDEIELRLSQQRYLVGSCPTEADWRFFTTLVRFDAVYYSHFKCNIRRLVDYPQIWSYTRELYQIPGVAETVNMDHIKKHYYLTHKKLNPSGILPIGPKLDFQKPHGRG